MAPGATSRDAEPTASRGPARGVEPSYACTRADSEPPGPRPELHFTSLALGPSAARGVLRRRRSHTRAGGRLHQMVFSAVSNRVLQPDCCFSTVGLGVRR